MGLSTHDRQLIDAIQGGLPLVPHPYADIGRRIGLSEHEVIERVQAMLAKGLIKRMGVVVRHHELGYRANAMVVWDVPDERVDAVGQRLGAVDFVTLCYRRPRCLPDWPYNLFCMIHGKDRDSVRRDIDILISSCRLTGIPYAVLFSGRRFKQRGARFTESLIGNRPATAEDQRQAYRGLS